jgi:hypothetical protein
MRTAIRDIRRFWSTAGLRFGIIRRIDHAEVRIHDLVVPNDNIAGGRP